MSEAKGASTPLRGVLVLGMHRSGTSATAAALQERGFALGDDLVPAAADNPEGYFEHAAAVRINDELLSALDRTWRDVRPIPDQWMDSDAAHSAAHDIQRELLPFFRSSARWALKDPRLCRLLPLWRDVLERDGQGITGLLVLRHPGEVAASLARRDGMPQEIASILWLRHVLEASIDAKGLPLATLDYASMLSDGGKALDAALALLGFELEPVAAQGLKSLRPALRNNIAKDIPAADAGAWERFAHETYTRLLATRHVQDVAAEALARFESMFANQGISLSVLGEALGESEHRNHAARERHLEQVRRGDELQHRLDVTDATLAEEQQRSLARLAAAEALQHELTKTQAALDVETGRSLERLRESESLRATLDETQQAFAEEAARSVERLREAEAFKQSLDEARQLFEEEAARSVSRLREAETSREALDAAQAAFTAEEARSLERLREAEALRHALDATQAAFSAEEARSLERLRLAEELRTALDATQLAFRAEQNRSIERLQQAEQLQGALDATQSAFDAEAARSIARLSQVEQLDRRLRESMQSLSLEQASRADLEQQLGIAEARIAAITGTRWWRLREAMAAVWDKVARMASTRKAGE